VDCLGLLETLGATLERYCSLAGVSGNEEPVLSAVSEDMRDYADRMSRDGFSNLLVSLDGPGDEPKKSKDSRRPLLLAAHADEKGLYTRKVHEDGLVAFDAFGLDRRCLPAQAVEIHSSTTRAPGVIQAALSHHAGDREVIDPSEMRIDVGATSKEDAETLGIRPGDPVTFLSPFTCLSGNLVMSKALDNRAGLVATMVALKRCSRSLAGPAILAATRQEESGMRGGGPAASSARPCAAIVVDVIGGQVYGYKERESREMLGKGVIVHYDPGVDRRMRDRALEVASTKGIRHQVHAMSGIGADALAIGQSAEGVPVLELFIPALHFHTPRALIDLSDVCSTVDLLESLLTDRYFFDLAQPSEQ